MPKKRWLLVWVGIGVLFVGPPAVLLNMNRWRVHERFIADRQALGEPPIVAAQEVEGIVADGEIGVIRPFEGLGRVHWVAVAPDGRSALCGTGNSMLQLVDLQTCKGRGAAFGGAQGTAACFSPDSKRAVVIGSSNMVYQFDVTTPSAITLTSSMFGRSVSIRCLAVAPNGKTAATGGIDRVLKIWNLTTDRELGYLYPRSDRAGSPVPQLCAVAYSADGSQLLSAGDDGTLCCQDLRTGVLLYTHAVHDGRVLNAAFSADGRYLGISTEDRTVRVWDTAQHKLVWKNESPGLPVQQLSFSRNGRQLLTQSRDDLVLWDLGSGQRLGSVRVQGLGNLRLEGQPIVALHPDGRHVIVGGNKPGVVTMLAGGATTRPTTREAGER